ncbi:MAG: RNA-directed DNA polymerase, partial [Bacteroides sp.]|nr:RNA-directed DNA polymerase [Bacteroides sp.]
QFIDASFNCRKGKGTLAAVKYLQEAIRVKSENYTKDCYILKYDLSGFFMSINRAMVTEKLCRFIRERYKGEDIETLIYLTRVTLLNSPADDCVIKGNREQWKDLAPNKSLFTVPEGYGLPIGNITSQLIANFLLDDTDHYLTETLGLTIDRYVDDTATVDTDKEKLLLSMPLVREHLWRTAGVRMNPKKYYLQHWKKGVKFLGMVIKGERLYLANRTLGKAMCRLHGYNKKAEEKGAAYCKANAENFVSTINSYLGLMRQGQEYGMRRAFCGQISEAWLKYVVVEWDFTKIVLKKKYKHRERVKRMLQRKRNMATKNYKIPKAKRMTARVFSGEKNLPAVEQFNTGRKKGCIVRWDFETVKTTIPEVDKRAAFRKRKAEARAARKTGGEPMPQQEPEQTQGTVVDSGMVAYSEMRYMGKPDPEKVLADIAYDLDLRYGDVERPEIDLEYYRTAIAALPE